MLFSLEWQIYFISCQRVYWNLSLECLAQTYSGGRTSCTDWRQVIWRKLWRWNHLNIISFPSEIMSQKWFYLSESRELFMHLSFYFFVKKLRPMSPPPDIDEAMKRIHGSTVNHQKCELALKFLSTGLGWRRGAVRDKLLFFQVSLPSHCRITRVLKKYM